MREKLVKYSLLLGGALLLMLSGSIIGYGHGKRAVVPLEVVKTDTIRTTDTIKLQGPPPPDTVTKTIVKTKKVPLHDTVTLVDSVWVDLPYEQHFARLDSVADVWYSGYEAKIDSAMIYKTATTVIERREVSVVVPRYNNTISIVAGFNDASVMYTRRLGRFVIGASAGYDYDRHPAARAVVGFSF